MHVIYHTTTNRYFLYNIASFLCQWGVSRFRYGMYIVFLYCSMTVVALVPPEDKITQYTPSLTAWQQESPYQGWLRKDTTYFTYIFEQKDMAIVDDLEAVVKEYAQPLQELFEHYIRSSEKVHIIIDGRAGYSNGSYRSVPPEIRLHTYAMGISGKNTSWIQFLFLHEFAHYLHLYYPSGLGHFFSYIFGPIAKSIPALLTPKWLIEGVGVYIESAYSNVGRLHNPFFMLPMRADILLDTLLPYSISRLNTSFEFQYGRIYLYGSFLFRYIQQQYGFDTFIELWREYLDAPFLFETAVKNKLGKSLQSIHKDMQATLYAQYFKESGYFPRGTMLETTILPSDKLSLVAATDKGSIYYKQGNEEPSGFLLLSKDTMQEQRLLSISAATTFFGTGSADATKDGNTLVFVARTYNAGATTALSNIRYNGYISYFNDLYTYSVKSNTFKQISQKQQLSMPSISNDASFIVATKKETAYNSLIKVDMTTHQQGYEILYTAPSSEILDKDISPHNKYVAFIEKNTHEGTSIVILDIATKQRTSLLQTDTMLFYDLRFINNTTVQFSSNIEYPHTVMQLYRFDIEKQQLSRIAQDSIGIVSALPTHDGGVLYQSNNGEGFALYHYTKQHLQAMTQGVNVNTLDTVSMPYSSISQTTDALPLSTTHAAFPSVLSFFPHRIAYLLPLFLLKYENATTSFYPGLELQLFSSNSLSNLKLQFLQYFDTRQTNIHFQPIYNITYGYSIRPIGDILISSSRSIQYAPVSETYLTQYKNTFSYGRLLWSDIHNNRLKLIANTTIRSIIFTPISLRLAESYTIENSLSFQKFGLRLQYSGKSTASSIRYPLSWNAEIGSYYYPPYWESNYHQYVHSLSSHIRVPLQKYFAIKISNKSTLSNSTQFTSEQQLHRLNRIDTITLIRSSQTVLLGYDTAFSNSPFKSIWSLDFIIPLGYNDRLGSYTIQPYAFFLSIYTDHSFAIDNSGHAMQSSYYDVGIENNIQFTIGGINTSISAGGLFRIPYDAQKLDYRLYILFGN